MDINVTEIQKARIKRDALLDMHHKPLLLTAPTNDDIYYIYVIENRTNGKRYIGKAKNIYDRALNYIRRVEAYDKKGQTYARPITQAMHDEGVDNFIMYPIATTNGKEDAAYLEQAFIAKFKTLYNENGYNVATWLDFSGDTPHCGYAHSIDTKIKKSKPMIAINDTTKVILIAVGGKILGDLFGVSKDLIKNVIRRPCRLREWYIYYLNDADRDEITSKYKSKRTCNINGIMRLRNENDPYLHHLELVERFAENPSADIFEDSNEYKDYKIIFVTYNREYDNSPLTTSYKLCPLEDFLALLE